MCPCNENVEWNKAKFQLTEQNNNLSSRKEISNVLKTMLQHLLHNLINAIKLCYFQKEFTIKKMGGQPLKKFFLWF